MTPSSSVNRVAIIGAGHVGATVAFTLMLRGIVGEIVLLDKNEKFAQAQALDIEHANALSRPARIWAGDYADAARAGIAVITAGATMKTAQESRLSLLDRSASIMRECVAELMAAGFAGIIVVAANPVDIMAQVAQELSQLPVRKVIGSGTLLDSARLRSMLGAKLGLIRGRCLDTSWANTEILRLPRSVSLPSDRKPSTHTFRASRSTSSRFKTTSGKPGIVSSRGRALRRSALQARSCASARRLWETSTPCCPYRR